VGTTAISSGFVSDELRSASAALPMCHLLDKENSYEELADAAAMMLRKAAGLTRP
jgi:hypothetical protein